MMQPKQHIESIRFKSHQKNLLMTIIFSLFICACGNTGMQPTASITSPTVVLEKNTIVTPTIEVTEIPKDVYIPITTEPWAYIDKRYCDYGATLFYDSWNETWRENGFSIVYGERQLSEVPLEKYALLILFEPNPEQEDFSKEDIEAINNYVEKGGQLFLLVNSSEREGFTGDYSGPDKANKVASNFGVEFDNKMLNPYDNDGWTGFVQKYHPITRNIVSWHLGNGPCSIKIISNDADDLLRNRDGDILMAVSSKGYGRALFLADGYELGYAAQYLGDDTLFTDIVKWFNPKNIDS